MAKRGTTAGIDVVELERLCMTQCTEEDNGIWLGKQILGQSDHMRHDIRGNAVNLVVVMPREIPASSAPRMIAADERAIDQTEHIA